MTAPHYLHKPRRFQPLLIFRITIISFAWRNGIHRAQWRVEKNTYTFFFLLWQRALGDSCQSCISKDKTNHFSSAIAHRCCSERELQGGAASTTPSLISFSHLLLLSISLSCLLSVAQSQSFHAHKNPLGHRKKHVKNSSYQNDPRLQKHVFSYRNHQMSSMLSFAVFASFSLSRQHLFMFSYLRRNKTLIPHRVLFKYGSV